jgi:hypothetical protein
MPGGLNQGSLRHKPNHFAPHYRDALFGRAGSDCFKRNMERCDDVIGEIHGDLNHLSAG